MDDRSRNTFMFQKPLSQEQKQTECEVLFDHIAGKQNLSFGLYNCIKVCKFVHSCTLRCIDSHILEHFRTVSRLLELDYNNYFYGQIEFVDMLPKVLEVLISYSSPKIIDERKEEVIGEATRTLMWILKRNGFIVIDKQTNEPLLNQSHRADVQDIICKVLNCKDTRFCEYLLASISDARHTGLEVALKILSFIRLLLELAPDNSNWNIDSIFCKNEFVLVTLNLLDRVFTSKIILTKDAINIVRGILAKLSLNAAWKEGVDKVLRIKLNDSVPKVKVFFFPWLIIL